MASEFIKPEELSDDSLVYWATHHAKRYIQLQKQLRRVEATHEAFLAECMNRDVLGQVLENLSNG